MSAALQQQTGRTGRCGDDSEGGPQGRKAGEDEPRNSKSGGSQAPCSIPHVVAGHRVPLSTRSGSSLPSCFPAAVRGAASLRQALLPRSFCLAALTMAWSGRNLGQNNPVSFTLWVLGVWSPIAVQWLAQPNRHLIDSSAPRLPSGWPEDTQM